MRKLFILALGLFFATQLMAQEEKSEVKDGPKITFKDSKHDFGDIHQGEVVEYTFQFDNKGNEPLVLTKVTSVFMMLFHYGVPEMYGDDYTALVDLCCNSN